MKQQLKSGGPVQLPPIEGREDNAKFIEDDGEDIDSDQSKKQAKLAAFQKYQQKKQEERQQAMAKKKAEQLAKEQLISETEPLKKAGLSQNSVKPLLPGNGRLPKKQTPTFPNAGGSRANRQNQIAATMDQETVDPRRLDEDGDSNEQEGMIDDEGFHPSYEGSKGVKSFLQALADYNTNVELIPPSSNRGPNGEPLEWRETKPTNKASLLEYENPLRELDTFEYKYRESKYEEQKEGISTKGVKVKPKVKESVIKKFWQSPNPLESHMVVLYDQKILKRVNLRTMERDDFSKRKICASDLQGDVTHLSLSDDGTLLALALCYSENKYEIKLAYLPSVNAIFDPAFNLDDILEKREFYPETLGHDCKIVELVITQSKKLLLLIHFQREDRLMMFVSKESGDALAKFKFPRTVRFDTAGDYRKYFDTPFSMIPNTVQPQFFRNDMFILNGIAPDPAAMHPATSKPSLGSINHPMSHRVGGQTSLNASANITFERSQAELVCYNLDTFEQIRFFCKDGPEQTIHAHKAVIYDSYYQRLYMQQLHRSRINVYPLAVVEGEERFIIDSENFLIDYSSKDIEAEDHLVKVYDGHLYFQRQAAPFTLKIWSIALNKLVYTMELTELITSDRVVQNSAIFATDREFFNVFSPQPLFEDIGIKPKDEPAEIERMDSVPAAVSAGVLMLHENVQAHEIKLCGQASYMELHARFEDSGVQYQLVDYIPERRVAIYQPHLKTEKHTIVVFYEQAQFVQLPARCGYFLYKTSFEKQSEIALKAVARMAQTKLGKDGKPVRPQSQVSEEAFVLFTVDQGAVNVTVIEFSDDKTLEPADRCKARILELAKIESHLYSTPQNPGVKVFHCKKSNVILLVIQDRDLLFYELESVEDQGGLTASGGMLNLFKRRSSPQVDTNAGCSLRLHFKNKLALDQCQEVLHFEENRLYFIEQGVSVPDLMQSMVSEQLLKTQHLKEKSKEATFRIAEIVDYKCFPKRVVSPLVNNHVTVLGLYSLREDLLLLRCEQNFVVLTDARCCKVLALFRNWNPHPGTLVEDRSITGLFYYREVPGHWQKHSLKNLKRLDSQAAKGVFKHYYRMNLFNCLDEVCPTSIPAKLLLKEELLAVYDLNQTEISYYESFAKRDNHQILASLVLRTQYNPQIDRPVGGQSVDAKINENSAKYVSTVSQMKKYIRESKLAMLLSYNLIHRRHLFFELITDEDIVEPLLNKVDGHLDPQNVPYMFLGTGLQADGADIFTQSVQKKETTLTKRLLKLMIKVDSVGLLYSNLVGPRVFEMFSQGIDLKGYFGSSMPYYDIHEDEDIFPERGPDQKMFLPANKASILEITNDYEGVIGHKLGGLYRGSTFSYVFGCHFLTSKRFKVKGNDDEIDPNSHEIEYQVVNMKHVIQPEDVGQRQQFMKIIQKISNKDLGYLMLPSVQAVITYKWKQYTKPSFVVQLVFSLVFTLAFILDIIFGNEDDGGFDPDSEQFGISCIVTRSICGFCMFLFLLYEMRQMCYLKLKEYVTKDWWNISDFILFALYASYLPISFLWPSDAYLVKILQCTIIFFLTIKINFFLRIFDSFSFLVQMILAVFKDLRHFLIYFCIIISAFAIQISIIQSDVEGHDGIGPVKYFVMTLRTAIGDNDIDEQFTDYKILFWIVWVMIVFIGNIVLMNFIIAVVNESYSQCMATNEAQSYKVKVDMIVEYESTMSRSELEDTARNFPRYIVVRRPRDINRGLPDEDQKLDGLIQDVQDIAEKSERFQQEIKGYVKELVLRESKSLQALIHNVDQGVKKLAAKLEGDRLEPQTPTAQAVVVMDTDSDE